MLGNAVLGDAPLALELDPSQGRVQDCADAVDGAARVTGTASASSARRAPSSKRPASAG